MEKSIIVTTALAAATFFISAGLLMGQVDTLKTRVDTLETANTQTIEHTQQIKAIDDKFIDIKDQVKENTTAQTNLQVEQRVLVERINLLLDHLETRPPTEPVIPPG
tara:strand:- start:131 stop:451 length:321 start_codon:yes stop_codon:yes gene_type:complete